jgi:hypothetical protein
MTAEWQLSFIFCMVNALTTSHHAQRSVLSSGFRVDCRQLGSYPETGFEEVGRLVPGSRVVEPDPV